MEHIALYRQFRPMTFDEIVEQKGPVSALRQSVISGKIGHAYLFSGQRGTGKTSIAKVFSRAINCEHPVNGNPCNECAICKGIINGSLMDVIEIDAASNNSVDNIRRICEEVNFAPSKASHKVYIIDEVHMLSTGAFNALLKTLEEPPKHVVFLLATTEPHRIPATIHSRCQRYDFKRISIDSIVSRLKYICSKEGFIATDDALSLIASLSDGAMRDAISLLDQAGNSSSDKSITRDSVLQITGTVDDTFLGKMAKSLIDGDYEAIINMCEELANSGRDITRFAVDLAQYFRDLLVVRMMPDPTKLVKVQTSTLKSMYEICQNVAAETLVAFISKLSAMISDLKWTPSVRTTFEITLIQLCGRKVKVEPVPLVVPDFIAKQQAFANGMSAVTSAPAPVVSGAPAVAPAPAPSPAPVVPEVPAAPAPKAEEPKESDNENDIIASIVAEAASVQSNVAEEAHIEPAKEKAVAPKDEGKKEEAPSPVSIMDDLIPPPADDELIPPPAIPEMDMIPPPVEDEEPPFDMPVPAPLSPFEAAMASNAPVVTPAPVPEEEVDPEDLPMENQIDLFSLSMAPADPTTSAAPVAESAPAPVVPSTPAPVEQVKETPVKKEEPKLVVPEEPKKPVAPVSSHVINIESIDEDDSDDDDDPIIPGTSESPLLSMISSSFLDDITSKSSPVIKTHNKDEEVSDKKSSAPEEASIPAAPFWEPVPDKSEKPHPKTSLAAVIGGSGELVVDKAPVAESEKAFEPSPAPVVPAVAVQTEARADLQVIWESVYSHIASEDYLMFVKLAGTKLQTIGENAYIVFDNNYTPDSLRQLTADPLYKKIRNDIMAVLKEIEHVYVATEKQYAKVLGTNNQSKPVLEEKQETNLDNFLNTAKEMGVDLHFGDD